MCNFKGILEKDILWGCNGFSKRMEVREYRGIKETSKERAWVQDWPLGGKEETDLERYSVASSSPNMDVEGTVENEIFEVGSNF